MTCRRNSSASALIAAALMIAPAARAESTFTHRIPLNLPRGANGMQPGLALVYAPTSPNGLIGMGWQLIGLASITRVNDGNGIRWEGADTYAHSEIGVLVRQSDGTFRSRKESFVRLSQSGTCGDGPCSWVARDRSGIQYFFGMAADSRVLKQGSGSVLTWALTRVQDLFGNYFDIAYANDYANGRTYPTSITYTMGPGLGTFRTIEFTYEARTDMESGYQGGAFVQTAKRLQWISVRSNGSLVRKYRLEYEYGYATGRSHLTRLQEFGSDGVSTAQPQTFAWQQGTESSAANPDLMTSVKNGLGGTVSVVYGPAPQVSGAVNPSSTRPGIANASPQALATRVTTTDGRGGSYSTQYVYSDARVYPGFVPDRRDLGFASMTVFDMQTGQYSRTFSNQLPGYEGTASSVEDRTATGQIVKQKLHSYELVYPPGTTGVELIRETQETLRAYELGTFAFSQWTTTTYDDFGNPTVKAQYADGLPTVTVTTRYANDATNWILGRITRMTTSSGTATLGDVQNVWSGNTIAEKWEWLDTTGTWLITKMSYDTYGNVVSVTEPQAADGLTRTTLTEFDSTFRANPTKVTNAAGHVTEKTYDADGNVTALTDANGRVVTITYDVFGRRRTESGPGAQYSEYEYRNYGDANRQCNRVTKWVDSTRVLWKEEYFDGSGFKYGVTSSGDCGSAWVVYDNKKDAAGRAWQVSQPYCYGGTPVWTTTAYDAAGRVASITTPDGKVTRYGHTSTYASVTDANGLVTKKYFDARNKTISVVDPAGQTTSYGYDALGRVTSITRSDWRP